MQFERSTPDEDPRELKPESGKRSYIGYQNNGEHTRGHFHMTSRKGAMHFVKRGHKSYA